MEECDDENGFAVAQHRAQHEEQVLVGLRAAIP